MDWWIFTELLLLIFFCSYLVLFFSSPSVPISIKITSILTWTLNFGLVLFVPSDIFQVLSTFGPQTKTVAGSMILVNP